MQRRPWGEPPLMCIFLNDPFSVGAIGAFEPDTETDRLDTGGIENRNEFRLRAARAEDQSAVLEHHHGPDVRVVETEQAPPFLPHPPRLAEENPAVLGD